MRLLNVIVKRVLAEAPIGPDLERPMERPTPATAATPSDPFPTPSKKKKLRKIGFVYGGYIYNWQPDERFFEIVAGPDYAKREKPVRVSEKSKFFSPIMAQYNKHRARVKTGLYPVIRPGMTNAEVGGALTRVIADLQRTAWIETAGPDADAVLSQTTSGNITYDEPLVQAVQSFQRSAGLEDDGVIAMTTHDAIINAASGDADSATSDAARTQRAPSDAEAGEMKTAVIKRVTDVVPALRALGYGDLPELSQVPDRLVIVVDGARQRISVRKYLDNSEIASYPCSTSKVGFKNQPPSDSHDPAPTATGLMRVYRKVGAGMPVGTVFGAREPVPDFNKNGVPNEPGTYPKGDLAARTGGNPKAVVATRIILIEGLQPENSGGNSVKERNIYFHGTNVEEMIGSPASGGCIRMMNSDVIKLFDMVTVGDVVYVMGRGPSDTPPLPYRSLDAFLSMGRYVGATGRAVGSGTETAPFKTDK